MRWRIRGTDITYSSGTGLVIAVVAIIVGSLGIATWAMVILLAVFLVSSKRVPPAGPGDDPPA